MAKAADTRNTFDPVLVQSLVNRTEGLFADLDSERGVYMKKCRDIRESIAAVYAEADARGIPKKEFRVYVKARMSLDKTRKILEDLESDQRDTVELLADAFGDAADLPLFEHRINQAKPNGEKPAAGARAS